MKKVRIGIIGLGSFCSSYHIPNLLNRTDVEIAAVCDISQDCLDKRDKRLAASQPFTDYGDMLDPDLIDGAFVSTPNRAHFAPCKLALERGIPTIVDKPITVTVADAEELVGLSKARNCILNDRVHAPLYAEHRIRAPANRIGCCRAADAHRHPAAKPGQTRDRRRGYVASAHHSHHRCFAVAHGPAHRASRRQNSVRK